MEMQKTVLFLGTAILKAPNVEMDDASERERGTESRSVRQTLKTGREH